MEYIVESGVFENFFHPFDLPLFDIVRMRIGQPKQAFGKMPNDGVLMQKFLVVKALGQHFLFRRRTEKRGLVGKG